MRSSQFVARSVIALGAAAVCATVSGPAGAQAFPSKPVEFVVHTAAGGGTDLCARTVAEIITREKLLAQPVTIANRVGGSGTVAFSYVKAKRGDPHVVLTIATGTLLTAASQPDFGMGLDIYTPLAFFALDPQVVAVVAGSKVASFKDLIEAGRREPNTIAASIASAGGSARLLLYQIERETGARYKYVAFKSGAEAALAVLGGHVPFTTENLSEMFTQVEAKKNARAGGH